ncbi:hypothetical protein B484DRAFT_391743, partial [Ochromonadaceae sp. CCMP2298]
AQLPLTEAQIDSDASSLWGQWDIEKNGIVSLGEFMDQGKGVIAYLLKHHQPQDSPVPDIRSSKGDWFRHWDDDHTQTLTKVYAVS